jgi:hypothetical protein
MSRAHFHLWCIGLLAVGCGEDVNPSSDSSSSTDTTTSGPDGPSDTSTDTTESTDEETTDPTESTDEETTDPTESTDEDTASSPVCGDGIIEADEVCDTVALAGETCMSQGFDSGTLGCAPDCMAFDTSACNLPSELRLLLTQAEEVQERALDGTLLNTTIVPLDGGTEQELRELTHWNGVTYLYRGTFSPTMTYYDDDLADWVHEPFLGWSTVNNVAYGGLAHADDWIWATDMITSGKPEIGLVRFSLVGLPTERVMDGEEYIDVFAGLDGLVYGLQSDGDTVDVIEPGSGLPMDVILLDAPARGIAVAEDGTIVGAAFDGNIYLLDATGGVLMSLAAEIESLVDVDLASDGTIAVSSSLGNVVIVEPGLGNIVWSWDAGGDETFLEFLE